MSLFDIDNTINIDSNSTPRLRVNEVHKVQLKEVEAQTLKGKDSKEYKVIYLKFQNDEGAIYEQRFFAPTATEATTIGAYGKQASDVTQFRYSIQHLIEGINPKLFQEIKEGKKFEVKTWDEMRSFVVKALTPGLNTNVYLKLLADNKGYATIPKYPVGMSKEGNPFMKTRFIASETQQTEKPILFTEKEKKDMETQAKAATSKPTKMDDVDFEKGAGVKANDKNFDI